MPKTLNPIPAAAAALVPFTLGLLLAATQPSNAQSFNCRSAHYTDEAAICQDPTLGRLDNRLNSVYNGVYRRLPPEAQRRLDRDEDAWVAQRRQCGADPACLTQAYHHRMRQLDSEIGSLQQMPLHNPPPGFPPPPPPFRPFGGAPVATAPDFAPRPPFAPPRQTTETIEERGTQQPVERRQSSETFEQRAAPAAQNEPRQSEETVERRDNRAAPTDRGSEGSTEAPSGTTTVITESRSAPEQIGAEQAQQPTRHKSSKRTRTSRSNKPAHETASEGTTDQNASSKPAQESAPPSNPHKETHATATPAPQPAEPRSGSSQEPKHAAPAKPASPPVRDQKREAAAAPAQQPQQSAGSSEASSSTKPAIRWVDPPPSK